MKALVKRKADRGLWMEEAPIPEIGPNDLLVRITKTAICGTDLHIYNWDKWSQENIKVPMIIGHEFVGIVEKVGNGVRGYKPGDRVSGEGHVICGFCRNCKAGKLHLCINTVGIGIHRQGCFAEYLSLPASNAFHIPDDISDDLASIFDPFGNAVHTALSFDMVGEDVLITGAGPIGIMATAIAKHVGARFVVVTDINDYRLEMAKKMGATKTVNVARNGDLKKVMEELGMKEGYDIGLEMSGSPAAFKSMLNVINNGGRIALLGIFPDDVAIDWSKVIFKGLFIKGIYGREMFETWYKMTTLLQSNLNISEVITHHFPVDDYEKAFEVMNSGMSGKVILEWT